MIHACGQVDLVDDLAFSPGVVDRGPQGAAGRRADPLRRADGRLRHHPLPAARRQRRHLHPDDPGFRRSPSGSARRAPRRRWSCGAHRLGGAVVAIGNAPTALFRLLDMIDAGAPRPAAVLGIPVGFIGAAESKAALAATDLEHLVVHGRRGGSAITAAAVNAMAARRRSCDGDALRRRRRARRSRARHGQGRAADRRRRRHRLPLARGTAAPSPADRRAVPARARSRRRWSTRSRRRPPTTPAATRARSTSSTPRPPPAWPRTWTPGATSSCSPRATRSSTAPTCTCTSGSRTATPPRSCPASPRSARRRRRSASRWWSATRCSRCCPARCPAPSWPAGSPTPTPRPSSSSAARSRTSRGAVADARASRVLRRARDDGGQRTAALADVDPPSVPYFAIALLPGRGRRVPARPRRSRQRGPGEVVVVGPGPAGRDWLTPQVAAVLSAADDLVGYGPYLDRVPPNPRQTRHASDNRVEAERAAHALDLAAAGRRVAVVSGGDPGVFAMAAAVLEVAAQEKYADVAGAGAARGDGVERRRRGGRRAAGPRPRGDLAVGPAEAVGGRAEPGSPPPPARTSRSRSTTRGRRPGRGSWRRRGTCCWSTAPRTRRSCSAATSAAPVSRSP